MSGEFKVDRVERKKEGEKGPSLKLPPSKKNFIVAAILYIAKKFVDLYEKNFQKKIKTSNFKTSIVNLKTLFEKLEKENLSKDTDFLKELSLFWIAFLKEYDYLYLMKDKKNKKVEILIEEIDNFNADQEYSLGYYLKEYKEENWHPFPFMDILNQLYLEHQKNPQFSHLNSWVDILEKIKE